MWKLTHSVKPWMEKLKRDEIVLEVSTIVNYMTYGKSKITVAHHKNLKPHKPMSVVQACEEYWISPMTFYSHLRKYPDIKEYYDNMKEDRREYIRESAESNIEKALNWWLELSDKDVVDASFKMLEKTDRKYNQKIEIETKTISVNINKSSEDLMADLSAILWLNNKQQ